MYLTEFSEMAADFVGGDCGLSPMLAMTKPLPKKLLQPANVRYLSHFEEIIFVKRKPPSKRLKVKYIPAMKLEVAPPVTGSSMVITCIDRNIDLILTNNSNL